MIELISDWRFWLLLMVLIGFAAMSLRLKKEGYTDWIYSMSKCGIGTVALYFIILSARYLLPEIVTLIWAVTRVETLFLFISLLLLLCGKYLSGIGSGIGYMLGIIVGTWRDTRGDEYCGSDGWFCVIVGFVLGILVGGIVGALKGVRDKQGVRK